MRRSFVVFGLVAALVLGTGAAVIASSHQAPRAASKAKSADAMSLAQVLKLKAPAAVNCHTVPCLNKNLTRLTEHVDYLFGCLKVRPVSQYGNSNSGYVYDPTLGDPGDEFNTSSLDYTVDVKHDRWLYMVYLKNTKGCAG